MTGSDGQRQSGKGGWIRYSIRRPFPLCASTVRSRARQVLLLLAGRLIDARKLRGGHWDIAISAIVIAAIAAIGIFLSTDHDDWLQSIMGRRH